MLALATIGTCVAIGVAGAVAVGTAGTLLTVIVAFPLQHTLIFLFIPMFAYPPAAAMLAAINVPGICSPLLNKAKATTPAVALETVALKFTSYIPPCVISKFPEPSLWHNHPQPVQLLVLKSSIGNCMLEVLLVNGVIVLTIDCITFHHPFYKKLEIGLAYLFN